MIEGRDYRSRCIDTTNVHNRISYSLKDQQATILAFILEHAQDDQRPYLSISIYGIDFLGLLDTGASRSVIGSRGWDIIKDLKLPHQPIEGTCKVANGQSCTSIGTIELPVHLIDRITLVTFLIVPDLPHTIILGQEFFVQTGIVPNLRSGTWSFSSETSHVFAMDMGVNILLTDAETKRLNIIVEDHFKAQKGLLGRTDRAEHVIQTDSPPIKSRYYPVNPVIQAHIDTELEKMLELGVVEPSKSPWASPILLVKKKDDTYRFCVDFRKLNRVTVKDSYPLPYVSSTLDKLRSARYITSLDIKSAYWQIPMSESSKQYTAFTVPSRGLYQFLRMPFGLHNAPATWQRLIDNIIGYDLEPHVFVYLDDIVIVTETFSKHLEILESVMNRLREANITLNREKCNFCRPEIKYLGYVVNRYGLHVDPDKVAAIVEMSRPNTVSGVRRVVGMASWYRRFIPQFSTIVAPITALLKKNHPFEWTTACEHSFQQIKQHLVKAPILSCPDYSLDFLVQTDASDYGLGAVLTQIQPDGDEKVICYLSRSLTSQERKYSTTEKECLAVLWSVEKLRPYLEGVKFKVITDHYSLVWLQDKPSLNGRLSRWSLRLQQFDFEIIHRKGKDNIVPDTLSRCMNPDITVTVDELTEVLDDKWYIQLKDNITRKPDKFDNYRLADGKIFKYVKPLHPVLAEGEDYWREVTPKAQRDALYYRFHDDPTSGHLGTHKTYKRISSRYYWPKMRQDIAKYVRKCKKCALHKPEQKKVAGLLAPHNPQKRPWEVLSTDLIGPLPPSSQGYTNILVVLDTFTKFCLLFPLRKATAASVVRHLENDVFLMYGAPRTILADNGVQFKSKEYRNLMMKYHVKPVYCPLYNPQSNPTERVNRVIKTIISTYVGENHRKWADNLQKVACAIRTSSHETTGYTPYFLNFSREIKLSGEDFNTLPCLDTDVRETTPKQRSVELENIYLDVQKKIRVASETSRKYYNLRRRDVIYEVDQLVLRKNHILSDATKYFSAKLAPAFIGPCRIVKKINRWMYTLENPDGTPGGTWNVKDLKPAPAI